MFNPSDDAVNLLKMIILPTFYQIYDAPSKRLVKCPNPNLILSLQSNSVICSESN